MGRPICRPPVCRLDKNVARWDTVRIYVTSNLVTHPVCRRDRRQMGYPICEHFVGRLDKMWADGTSNLPTSYLQIGQNVARWEDVCRRDGTYITDTCMTPMLICIYIYIYIYIYIIYSTINKVKVAGFFIPKTHMAFRLILFSELTSGK